MQNFISLIALVIFYLLSGCTSATPPSSDPSATSPSFTTSTHTTVRATITTTPSPTPLPFAELGQIAFVSDRDGNPEIYVLNADGSGLTRLTTSSAGESDPSWSPDGSRIAFVSDIDGNEDIYLMNADGSGMTRLTSDPASDRNPAWSPNGTRIAFASQRDVIPGFEGPPSEIYIMNSDGSQQTRMTNNTAGDYCPVWSDDRLAFSSFLHSYNSVRIDIMTMVDPQPIKFIDTPGDDYCPKWSPDGTRMAFIIDNGNGIQDIFLANGDGSNSTNLSDSPGFYGQLAWSPDGKWIAYSSRQAEWEISVVSVDGSSHASLTKGRGSGGWAPSWRP